jgi:hypothetical protein
MRMGVDRDHFPLSDLISALTAELREARYKAERKLEDAQTSGHPVRHPLQVVGASIDLAVEFERTGEGGISFKVLGIGADAQGALKRANTTTMTVQLAPQQGDVWVAGEEAQGER